MEDVERLVLRDTINGQEWVVGDKFLCPIYENGLWIISGQSFKFLANQYEVIEKGWAFRFTGKNDSTYIMALDLCNRLVEQLNNNRV